MQRSEMELNKEITQLTLDIQKNFRELYKKLEEMPITVPNHTSYSLDVSHLEDYLESLKNFKKTFEASH